MPDPINQQLLLKNGCKLGYAEYGDMNGQPIFFLHGEPGSRLTARIYQPEASRRHVHLIAPEYPGVGLSDPQTGYQLLDWPDMLIEQADALKIERFGVIGISGGGPFTLACAYKIPERLSSVCLVSAAGPLVPESMEGMSKENIEEYTLAAGNPEDFYAYYSALGDIDPADLIKGIQEILPPPDQAVMNQPATQRQLIEDFVEAFRQGTQGTAYQAILYAHSYGFELEQIRIPVAIWQGEVDVLVPKAMGYYLARRLPSAQLHMIHGEGHLSVLVNYAGDILAGMQA